ncbi:MAG: ABC transporter permease subunit [Myxococcales bacterium]|nr:ABC transporter permease subunit [Myxococcales bacterium]
MTPLAGPREWPAPPSNRDRAFRAVGGALAGALAVAFVAVAAALVNHARGPTPHELALFGGTLIAAGMATVAAAPIALGVALYVVDLGPSRGRRPVAAIVELMTVVPPVVYGLWGAVAISPRVDAACASWLSAWSDAERARVAGLVSAAVMLTLMIAPTVASQAAQVLRAAPPGAREAATGLGGTRWDIFLHVILPRTRWGLLGAVALGLGRAMGEGVAVALATGCVGQDARAPLTAAGAMVNGLETARASGDWRSLGALGLGLFVMTLASNMIGRALVDRVRNARRPGT